MGQVKTYTRRVGGKLVKVRSYTRSGGSSSLRSKAVKKARKMKLMAKPKSPVSKSMFTGDALEKLYKGDSYDKMYDQGTHSAHEASTLRRKAGK